MAILRFTLVLAALSLLSACETVDCRSKEPYCRIHGQEFEVRTVPNHPPDPTIHPFIRPDPQYPGPAEFPHAQGVTSAHSDALFSNARVSICPACLEAAARWKLQQGDTLSFSERHRYNSARSGAEDDRVSFPDICPVHGEALRDDAVPIIYWNEGTPPDGYDEAKKQFPFAYTKIAGGCSYDPKHQRMLVRYCSQCRLEQAKWLSQRPVDERLPTQFPPIPKYTPPVDRSGPDTGDSGK